MNDKAVRTFRTIEGDEINADEDDIIHDLVGGSGETHKASGTVSGRRIVLEKSAMMESGQTRVWFVQARMPDSFETKTRKEFRTEATADRYFRTLVDKYDLVV